MKSQNCISCQSKKALLECEVCHDTYCKNCVHFLPEDSFSYSPEVAKILKHQVYCHSCYLQHVEAELAKYNETLEAAKNVNIFLKKQGKETRLMSRKEPLVKVINCLDEEEVLMRLAFLAVRQGFNAVIDVDPVGVKVQTGTYQTTNWSGVGRFGMYTPKEVVLDRSIWSQPN